MPLARANGIRLFYDEAGAGRSVIFVHAYPMGRRQHRLALRPHPSGPDCGRGDLRYGSRLRRSRAVPGGHRGLGARGGGRRHRGVHRHDPSCIAPSEFMAERTPKAELTVIAGCGHFNNLERPAEFNRVLETFFRKIGWEA